MMSDELRNILVHCAITYLKSVLPDIPDNNRLLIIQQIQEGYCAYCGSDNPDCHCENDE